MKKTFLFLLLLTSFLLTDSIHSAQLYDPAYRWKTIATRNFKIHFHQGLELHAKKLASIAERVHINLVAVTGWHPWSRTHVILADSTDLTNGFAMPVPRNRIEIYLARPETDSSLNNFDDWLELVFTHEYTHTLNIDTAYGLVAASRNCPGRCIFPNAYQPLFMIEGNAVYQESSSGTYGRNNSTYTDMVMRTEIENNRFKDISLASIFTREWPRGTTSYLYGGLFIKYLHDRYGTDSVAKYFQEVGDDIIPYWENLPLPYFYNKDSRTVFSKELYKIWSEWKKIMVRKYSRQIEIIRDKKNTVYNHASDKRIPISLFRISRDGKYIYFVQEPEDNQRKLVRLNLLNGKIKSLNTVRYPESLSLAENGDAYLTDPEFSGGFNIFRDLFISKEGSYNQVTKGKRIQYIDVSADGSKILFIQYNRGKYSLGIANRDFSQSQFLIKPTEIQLANVRLSPDESRVLLEVKDFSGYAHIAVININSGLIDKITSGQHQNIHPSWKPNGKEILFSSDRDGVYNIYEYNMQENTVRRLTNMVTGAFSPQMESKSKKIYMLSYGKNGPVLSTMPYSNTTPAIATRKPLQLPNGFFTQTSLNVNNNELADLKAESYSPLDTLYPSFIVPVIFSNENYPNSTEYVPGFFTTGTDILFRHTYILSAFLYTESKRISISADYVYSKLLPDLFIGYFDNMLFVDEDPFPWENKNNFAFKRTLERDIYAGLLFPFRSFYSLHNIQITYTYEREDVDIYRPSLGTEDLSAQLARIQLAYQYSNTEIQTYSISQDDGFTFLLVGDYFSEKIYSDYTYYKVRSEGALYLSGPFSSHVLMSRVRGGYAEDVPSGFEVYPLGRFVRGERGVPETGEDAWGLRGYRAGETFGTRLATATFEYRFPLFQKDAGVGTLPFHFRDLWLTAFYELGSVWSEGENYDNVKTAAGAELHMRWTLGYRIDLTGTIGIAEGFEENGERQFYFSIGTLIEGAFKNQKMTHRI